MSHPPQRKSRHRHQPSGGGARTLAASDYESDAARCNAGPAELPPPPPAPSLAHRTNTDLNLCVLRRYLPSICSIVSVAANAAVYTFAPASGTWERSNVQGTLFVCEQESVISLTGRPVSRACVFVLNRHGLDNLVIQLHNTVVCEVVDELINFYVQNDDESGTPQDTRVIGLWIHADQENTRHNNTQKILDSWQQSRLETGGTGSVQGTQEEDGEGEAAATPSFLTSVLSSFHDSSSFEAGGATTPAPSFQTHHLEPGMANQGTASPQGRITVADYQKSLEIELQSIADVETWLRSQTSNNNTYHRFTSAVYWSLASNKARLVRASQIGPPSPPRAVSSWSTISWIRTSALTVTVTGVGPDPREAFELHMGCDNDIHTVERLVSSLASAVLSPWPLEHLLATEDHISRLALLGGVIQRCEISGSPCHTVHNHIQLLGQYNEVKDTAQQLIGLVADNRGLPVRSIYQRGEYGVGLND